MKTTISRATKTAIVLPAALVCAIASTANAGEWSANASMTSNYIWRGLTQTENEAAVQGGIDYAADNGFYAGTWASNVNYGAGDVYSYEHDVYAGYAFSTGDISWDVGYLYYNYDSEAEFDFGEVYVGMGLGDFSVQYNLLAEIILVNFIDRNVFYTHPCQHCSNDRITLFVYCVEYTFGWFIFTSKFFRKIFIR